MGVVGIWIWQGCGGKVAHYDVFKILNTMEEKQPTVLLFQREREIENTTDCLITVQDWMDQQTH